MIVKPEGKVKMDVQNPPIAPPLVKQQKKSDTWVHAAGDNLKGAYCRPTVAEGDWAAISTRPLRWGRNDKAPDREFKIAHSKLTAALTNILHAVVSLVPLCGCTIPTFAFSR